MPDPKEQEPAEDEQYGPPKPPKATRTWRMPSTAETLARDAGLGDAYDVLRKGDVRVPLWMKILDPLQIARDATGWELPTSEDVLERTAPERDLRRRIREIDRSQGELSSYIPDIFESLPGDALTMARLTPLFPYDWVPPGMDPLQAAADVYNRSRRPAATEQEPREGSTEVEHVRKSGPDPESYLERQEDGTFLTRVP